MNTPKFLIVDDDPTIRLLLMDFLMGSGYRADCVGDGLEALERMGKERYAAIIIDYNMAKMNGVEFVKKVRAQDNFVPIVAMSAIGVVNNLFIEAGADLFMEKPFGLDKFMIMLESVVDKGKQG